MIVLKAIIGEIAVTGDSVGADLCVCPSRVSFPYRTEIVDSQ